MKPLPVPDLLITDLPPTRLNGSTNHRVVTDRLSKSVILESLKEITADAVTKALLQCLLVEHHSLPRAITTDRTIQFMSHMWRWLRASHPKTDGATERASQEVGRYIRIFVTFVQHDWDELLPAAAMAMNNRTATPTGLSPFFFTHGYYLEPIEIKEQLRVDGKLPITKTEWIVQRLREATGWAQTVMASAQE